MRRLAWMIPAVAAAGLAPPAAAQPSVAETARRAELPRTAMGSRLQSYALLPQSLQQEILVTRRIAAEAPASYAGGAMTPARQALMQAVRDAYEGMRNAPPSIEGSPLYEETQTTLHEAFDIIAHGVESRRRGDAAAGRALAAMDRLRFAVADAAAHAGAAVPAPPLAGAWPR